MSHVQYRESEYDLKSRSFAFSVCKMILNMMFIWFRPAEGSAVHWPRNCLIIMYISNADVSYSLVTMGALQAYVYWLGPNGSVVHDVHVIEN